MTRTRSLRVLTLITIGAAVLALAVPAARAQTKITFALDWVPYGKHAIFFVPLDKGYWKEDGLEVTVNRGYGSAETVKRVAAGTEMYGFADIGNMLVGRSKGMKVKMIGMIHDKSMHGIYTVEGYGINTLKDFEGKRFGAPVGGATRNIFPAFAAVNGVDPRKVEWVDMSLEALTPSLFAHRIDGGTYFQTEVPTLKAQAEKVGKKVKGFVFSEHGLDIYSNGLITTDERAKGKLDEVRRFVRGVYRGVEWTWYNPEAANEIFLKYHPVMSKELTIQHLKIALDSLLSEASLKSGVGWMDRGKMQKTNEVLTKYQPINPPVPTDEAYTNEFLPKIILKPRR
ncbi:MAG: ABC transporter substrate-binding protein [Deltaproteobacteria bacterium]|nr:ABC transporter substrate-binding protein [Deltaproteobacteria bacterium]